MTSLNTDHNDGNPSDSIEHNDMRKISNNSNGHVQIPSDDTTCITSVEAINLDKLQAVFKDYKGP